MNQVRANLYGKNQRTKLNIAVNVLVALVFIVLLFELYFSATYSGIYIVHSSMRPTLVGAESEDVIGGDYVYVNKNSKPDYGDVVVVYDGKNNYLIKRLIAFGGDTVKLDMGQLYIKYGGQNEFTRVEESYIHPDYCNPGLAKNTYPRDRDGYLVPEGEIFLLGDNRNDSIDSRNYGSFPIENVDGVVTEWSINHKSFCTSLYNFFEFKLPGLFGKK